MLFVPCFLCRALWTAFVWIGVMQAKLIDWLTDWLIDWLIDVVHWPCFYCETAFAHLAASYWCLISATISFLIWVVVSSCHMVDLSWVQIPLLLVAHGLQYLYSWEQILLVVRPQVGSISSRLPVWERSLRSPLGFEAVTGAIHHTNGHTGYNRHSFACLLSEVACCWGAPTTMLES